MSRIESDDWDSHDPHCFNLAIYRSPDKWFGVARNLFRSAELVQNAWRKAHRTRRVLKQRLLVPDLSTQDFMLHAQAEMLRAMAFECELKGYILAKRLAIHGHVKDIQNPPSHHNLVALVKELGVVVNTNLMQNLKWQTSMIQMGRYPVTLSNGGREMTTSFGTAPTIAHWLYHTIRMEIPSDIVRDDLCKFSRKHVRAMQIHLAEHQKWQAEERRRNPKAVEAMDRWREQNMKNS